MIINRAYEFRLYPTNEQKILVNKTFGCTRFIYNYYLDKKINEYKDKKNSLSCYDTIKDLKNLYIEYPFLKEVDSISLRCSLFDLDNAYNNFFKDSLTSFPIINIYQIQTLSQAKILDEKARILDYYIKSRLELEKIFKETEMRPKRWENYRPLWYKYFETEQMPNNTFGQLEKIKRR